MTKFKMTEEQFNAERASGKSVAQIAKEQGVTEVTVYNHISKWADARKPKQEKLLREKDVSPPGPPSEELLLKAEKEIERLTSEVTKLEEYRVEVCKDNDRLSALLKEVEQDRIEYKRMFESGYKLSQDQTAKISEHLATINSLREDCDNLVDEVNRLTVQNADLEEQLSQREPINAVPNTEVHRLDSAIQDLTRARWILNRLSASGE